MFTAHQALLGAEDTIEDTYDAQPHGFENLAREEDTQDVTKKLLKDIGCFKMI